MQDQTTRIPVGKIAGLYGIKGWLKIVSYTRPVENLLNYSPWQLKQGNDWLEINVRQGKIHGKGLIAVLGEITGREGASSLVGADILIKRCQLQEPAADEYYQHDLLNMQVINQQGTKLGVVKEFIETGANEVLVVMGPGRHLIPWVWGRYVTGVDMQHGMIRVDWPPPEWDVTES